MYYSRTFSYKSYVDLQISFFKVSNPQDEDPEAFEDDAGRKKLWDLFVGFTNITMEKQHNYGKMGHL